jgi:hypothetical protein
VADRHAGVSMPKIEYAAASLADHRRTCDAKPVAPGRRDVARGGGDNACNSCMVKEIAGIRAASARLTGVDRDDYPGLRSPSRMRGI